MEVFHVDPDSERFFQAVAVALAVAACGAIITLTILYHAIQNH
jgi:hypothetical protein